MQDQVMECSVTRARVFFPGGPHLFSFRDVGSTRGEFPDCRGFSERGIQMAIIEESIEIASPVEKVFALTTDAAQWSRWHSAIPEAEQTSAGPCRRRDDLPGYHPADGAIDTMDCNRNRV